MMDSLFTRGYREPIVEISCKFGNLAYLPTLEDVFSAAEGQWMIDRFLSSALYLICEPFPDRVLVADALFFH